MASLTDLRKSVAAALNGAGLNAAEYVAERITPPMAVVVPDEPYIDYEDTTFGHANVNMSVLLVGGKGTNHATADQVDSLIETALAALEDEWDITSVSQPGEINLNGHAHLGAVITLTQETKIGGQ